MRISCCLLHGTTRQVLRDVWQDNNNDDRDDADSQMRCSFVKGYK